MTVEIQLNDADALALRQRAQALGQEFSEYVGAVLRRESRRAIRTFDQIAEGIVERRGGVLEESEAETGELLEIAKHKMRAERNQQAGS